MIGANYVRKENIWKCLGEIVKHCTNVRHLYDCCKAQAARACEYFNAIIIQYFYLKQQEPEDNC